MEKFLTFKEYITYYMPFDPNTLNNDGMPPEINSKFSMRNDDVMNKKKEKLKVAKFLKKNHK